MAQNKFKLTQEVLNNLDSLGAVIWGCGNGPYELMHGGAINFFYGNEQVWLAQSD